MQKNIKNQIAIIAWKVMLWAMSLTPDQYRQGIIRDTEDVNLITEIHNRGYNLEVKHVISI